MSKIDKKKSKLQERITFLENELTEALTKKVSNTKEIDVASCQRKIYELKLELKNLK